MPAFGILGAQWGDEGKGKIVDLFVSRGDIVARFQGGDNAGHTIVIDGNKFILHLLPSGTITEGKISVLGNGMVINLDSLLNEISSLENMGISVKDRILISSKAHVLLPFYRGIDESIERTVTKQIIGTTKKGIGPAYAFKALRKGIRISDIFQEETILMEKIETLISLSRTILSNYNCELDTNSLDIYNYLSHVREKIRHMVIDCSSYLINALNTDKKVIVEGSQGCLLDIDHGTYPFVTSSSSSAGGISPGLGIPFKMINILMGVTKAYTTRVGNGPFPSECAEDNAAFLREAGEEYGATTHRPRRCGWLDMVLLKYSCRTNAYDCMALTKADILRGMEIVPVCTGYRYKNSIIKELDDPEDILSSVTPVYKEFKGWKEDISSLRDYERLPQGLKDFISFIEDSLNTPIVIISTGPQRDQTIFRESGLLNF